MRSTWPGIGVGFATVLLVAIVIPPLVQADGDHGSASRVIRAELGGGRYDLWISLSTSPLLAGQGSVIKAQIIDRHSH